jgi:Tfp pilus assembly protein PilF
MRHVGIIGPCILLAALTLIAFLPVRQNGFVDFDDEPHISNNQHVKQGLSWSGVRWAFSNYEGNYWMPLAWLSLQADTQLFTGRTRDGQPNQATIAAIHTHNLLWHLGSVLLLFGLLQRLTGATFSSFVVAGLFAVHPMRVESVAWAFERKDVMSVFFGILTLWAYAWYAAKPGWFRYMAAILAYALGLMCKPMLMTIPLILLLLDYWPLRRFIAEKPATDASPIPAPGPLPLARLLLEKVPFALLAVATAVVTQMARSRAGALVSWELIPLSARLGTAATGYGWYLVHTIWPANLAALYPHPGRDWSVTGAVEGVILLSAITAVAVWQARRRRWLFVGWCWFVGTLFPVIGLSQGGEQAWADRFCYWPHIGLLVVIVWGIGELVRRSRVLAWLCGAIALVVLGVLVHLTRIQVGYWHDTRSLWERALDVTPNNDVAHLHLGGYYSSYLDVPAKAELHFAEAVRIQPDNGVFRNYLAEALLRQGKVEQATKHLEVAVNHVPDFLPAWRSLGMARMRLNQPKEAVACYQEVVRLMPDSAEALTSLGWAQWKSGLHSEAVTSFESAIHLEPKMAERLTSLAMQLATDPDAGRRDPQLAFELASLSVGSSGDAPAAALDSLAAAQAALGRFTEAIKTAKRAVAKADAANETQLARSIAERLHCYEKQTAFVQPPKPRASTP